MKTIVFPLLSCVLILTASAEADPAALLKTWCDAMIVRQAKSTGDRGIDGALLCPACGFMHGRAADIVYPMCVMWARTGESRYLDAAISAVRWTDYNMTRSDGAWCNDWKSSWRGTVTFAQIALGKTLVAYEKKLPREIVDEWRGLFIRHSEYLIRLFYGNKKFRPVINYPVAFVECMALAAKLTGESRYRDLAQRMLTETVVPSFLPDGLFTGEGDPANGRSANGRAFVDFGYNLEESLPSLLESSELLQDGELEAKTVTVAKTHLEFMLPDGAIDNSCGSRLEKWTYYGSRTSDGVVPLLLGLANRNVLWASKALGRHLDLLSHCTLPSGLLAGGLHYGDADEYACIHHTFTHAKALAVLVEKGWARSDDCQQMPREISPRAVHFDSIATDLAAVGKWRVTVSLNDGYRYDRGSSTTGGSVTMLWHEDFGPVLAATMYRFKMVEPLNFQEMRHAGCVNSTVPCIEANGFSNVLDFGLFGEMRHGGSPNECRIMAA